MKYTKLLIAIGFAFLVSCSNNQSVNSNNNSSTVKSTDSANQTTAADKKVTANHAAVPQKGGQVVESGAYHLEFVPQKEAQGTHLDFYLQKGDNHEPVPNAKVTAQVQLPDGTQKTVSLTYDAAGKHYAALLQSKASGQYQLKITSDIQGQKVDGRFTFSQ